MCEFVQYAFAAECMYVNMKSNRKLLQYNVIINVFYKCFYSNFKNFAKQLFFKYL